jgi:dihydroorotate dehydrogenase
MGNPGRVMWRDAGSGSTQNRVGLKNPGASAAAAFLSRHAAQMPTQYGINIAVSPGLTSTEDEQQDVIESLSAFTEAGLLPTWFTLNLSCPNTDDDPGGHQTEDKTRQLCSAVISFLNGVAGKPVPLWVKVSPGMAEEQYHILMKVFHEVGVKAVIATNTIGAPTPDDPTILAGIGGGRLHQIAVDAAAALMQARADYGYAVDVIGCGGVQDNPTHADFARLGVTAMQYWSALIYRGPLAAAVIAHELTMEPEQ